MNLEVSFKLKTHSRIDCLCTTATSRSQFAFFLILYRFQGSLPLLTRLRCSALARGDLMYYTRLATLCQHLFAKFFIFCRFSVQRRSIQFHKLAAFSPLWYNARIVRNRHAAGYSPIPLYSQLSLNRLFKQKGAFLFSCFDVYGHLPFLFGLCFFPFPLPLRRRWGRFLLIMI